MTMWNNAVPLDLLAAVWVLSVSSAFSGFRNPSRGLGKEELELPITQKKLIIAHFMPGSVFFKGGRVSDNCKPENALPDGSAAKIGGLIQAVPMSGILRPEVSLVNAAEHEIRVAQLAGLDGFQFFIPLPGVTCCSSTTALLPLFTGLRKRNFRISG